MCILKITYLRILYNNNLRVCCYLHHGFCQRRFRGPETSNKYSNNSNNRNNSNNSNDSNDSNNSNNSKNGNNSIVWYGMDGIV